jgi:hypothetical protein
MRHFQAGDQISQFNKFPRAAKLSQNEREINEKFKNGPGGAHSDFFDL